MSYSKDALQFSLTISITDGTIDELDHVTRQLLMELRELNIESVNLAVGDNELLGAKGVDPVTTGAIILAVLPTMLPKILEFFQEWSIRGKGRNIKFKGKLVGQQIEFEGSLAEMQQVLQILEKKEKKTRK